MATRGRARRQVHGGERTGNRGEGLHGGAQADRLTRRHAALDAPRASGLAPDAALPHHDLVVGVRSGPAGRREPVADLHALHRLDAHQGQREPRVELAVVVHVRAEPGRHAVRHHLEDPADRVLRPPDPIDLGDHPIGGRLVRCSAPAMRRSRPGPRGRGRATGPGASRRRSARRARARRPRSPRGTPCSRPPRRPARPSPGRSPAPRRCARRRTRTSARRPGPRGPAADG